MGYTGLVLRRIWLAVGLVACIGVLAACLMPNPPTQDIARADKLEHFAAFAVLGTWFGALYAPRDLPVLIGLGLFGAVIEITQAMTSYRSGDWADWVADALGILVGLAIARLGAARCLKYIDRRVAANRNLTG